ncbi:hydroxyacylglutathione hydrolase family protein [Psittacicella gerlachiana]|uniref:hydroxyacylglutathione hydrolase n=1 Tax=Psittacicella gerlachiana TaxID=2028574 RepID=A0A3A1YC30_9GAMM|nr:hydroxyacylglutathione hydrolase family protein [Psittacicella gerlachiana]RIY34769.1 hypothetical protein CKF59_04835 [Psittacicella gerlachiana]
MLHVDILSALSDNYIYVLRREDLAIVIDIGEFAPVQAYLEQHQLQKVAVLITHKHFDHVSGLEALLEAYPQTKVYTKQEIFASIPFQVPEAARCYVTPGQKFILGGLEFLALDTPGHTDQHLVFTTENLMFTGDLIFNLGCGRVMPDGDYLKLYNSLQLVKDFIGEQEFKLYPGHEYTLGNLAYALALAEQDSTLVPLKEQIIAHPQPPIKFSEQLAYNPFLRATDFPTFKQLRQGKDTFVVPKL